MAKPLKLRKKAVGAPDTAKGLSVWSSATTDLTIAHAAYFYRTKYGSHRFPVLVITGKQGALRLGVWDVQPQWQHTDASAGSAPQYLVGSPDWERLLSSLGRLSQSGKGERNEQTLGAWFSERGL